MSLNTLREDNLSLNEEDENDNDLCERNKFIDNADRDELSWMLSLILNIKSQKEIAQDISNGIIEMVEIENMFPAKYVQELLENNCESTENYLNRFKDMTDERMKVILKNIMRQLMKKDLLCVLKLNNTNFMTNWTNFLRNKITMNSQTTFNPLSMVTSDLQSGNNLGTKKKRYVRKNVNVNNKNNGEIPIKEKKLPKNKLSSNDENKNENTVNGSSNQLWVPCQEETKESSISGQEENETSSVIIENNTNRNKKKMVTKKKPGPRKSKVQIVNASSSEILDKVEEPEKSETNENTTNIENDESNLTKSNDCCKDIVSETSNNLDLEKSLSNSVDNISHSTNTDKEICGNKNQEIVDDGKYKLLDKTVQLDSENDVIQVKKEPMENYYEELMESNSKETSKLEQSKNNVPQENELKKSESISNCKRRKRIKTKSSEKECDVTDNKEKELQKLMKMKKIRERENNDILRKCKVKLEHNLDKFKNQMSRIIKDIKHAKDEEDDFSDSSEYSTSTEESSSCFYSEYSTSTSSENSSDYTESSSTEESLSSCHCCDDYDDESF
ncbi:hypothetical protein M0802_005393 [Mischocyttarus mexicanus]|nr:hypothetical protein M0802_005393 [Mischocyttarus mexicanus]